MNDAVTNIEMFRRRMAISQARHTFYSLWRSARYDGPDQQAAFDLAVEAHELDKTQARDLADWIEAERTIALAKIA